MKPVEGVLAGGKTQEANESWPQMIEVVAYFGKEGRKGKRKSIEITGDQFFGRGRFGAPMSGDQLIRMIDQLRRG